MTPAELATAQRIELGYLRQNMVDAKVQRRIDRRDGNVTNAEIEAWTRNAYQNWRETYPALSQMFTSILPADSAVTS